LMEFLGSILGLKPEIEPFLVWLPRCQTLIDLGPMTGFASEIEPGSLEHRKSDCFCTGRCTTQLKYYYFLFLIDSSIVDSM
jgi:hypothetical protein